MNRFLSSALTFALILALLTGSVLAVGDAESTDGPRTRWWVYDASVGEEQIRAEMADIAAKGYGGIEVCNKGGYAGGLGTGEWNREMDWLLDACEENGLSVSFSYQNDSPISLPSLNSDVKGEQAVTKLRYSVRSLTAEDFSSDDDLTFIGDIGSLDDADSSSSGEASGFGETGEVSREFVAVTAARMTGGTHTYEKTASTFGNTNAVAVQTTELDPASMQTLDAGYDPVTGVITLDWTLPAGEDPAEWLLFVWYAQSSGNTVNIFSRSGAEALIDFWKETYMTERMEEYLQTHSVEVFEDSIEISQSGDIVFTWSMMDVFRKIEEETGYNMLAYLPLAIGRSYGMNTSTAQAYGFAADEDGFYADEQFWNDYTDILAELFAENHLQYLSEAFGELGITYRVQAYSGTNSNFYDVTRSSATLAAYGGLSEGETLAFSLTNDGYDAWRYVTGGTHMGGGQLVPNEYAAVSNYGWRITFADMADIANRSVAGGANLFTNHGYNSDYDTSAWPGYNAFGDMFTEAWDDRDPAWEGYNILTGYLSRLQGFTQSGTAKLDLAVWHDGKTVMDPAFQEYGVTDYGYTYEFVNANVLDQDVYPLAVVTNGRLAEAASAYQALVLYDQIYLDIADMELLSGLAEDGLPIVFVGEMPKYSASLGEALTAEKDYADALSGLLSAENVYTVSGGADEFDALMESIGILPCADYSDPCSLLSVHREDDTGALYWFFAPDDEDIQTTVTMQGHGAPYSVDLWSGQVTELINYTTDGDTVTLSLTVPAKGTRTIVLTDAAIPNTTEERVAGQTAEQLDLSDSDWTLDVVSFTANPDAPNDRRGLRSVLDTVELNGLQPWNALEGLETVSGVGTYETIFRLDDLPEDVPVTLSLTLYGEMGYTENNYWSEDGMVYYPNGTEGTSAVLSVRVNGVDLPILDQSSLTTEISRYLHEGENTLEISVSTTLYNARFGTDAFAYGLAGVALIY